MESAQYLYMNIEEMNGYFNWTMTYRRDSDFPRPYGHIVKVMVDSVLEFGCHSFVYGYFGDQVRSRRYTKSGIVYQ